MSNGSFSGNPRTEWLSGPGEDRDMKLLEPFSYLDPAGRLWEAPAGSLTDGASIPHPLWSSVGSPYTGDYRRASVIHDVACRTPGVVRRDADTMFYFACLAGGCAPLQAKLLYAGVRVGAWATDRIPFGMQPLEALPDGSRLPGQHAPAELEVRAKYTLVASELQTSGNDFDAIQAIVDRHLGQEDPP